MGQKCRPVRQLVPKITLGLFSIMERNMEAIIRTMLGLYFDNEGREVLVIANCILGFQSNPGFGDVGIPVIDGPERVQTITYNLS
jgi:hypothetical protein